VHIGRNGHRRWLRILKLSVIRGEDRTSILTGISKLTAKNQELLNRVKSDYYSSIKMLSHMIDISDPYTHGHSGRVMRYAMKVCKKLGIEKKEKEAIKNAALLHDIGKVFIDKKIINKKTRLTKSEWKKIRKHPVTGAKIVSELGFLHKAVPIIYHHHEEFSGGGYPTAARRGEDIPLGARIISVCDAYEAMTSKRAYRDAYSKEYAIKELKRCAGTQFDPKIVRTFTMVIINGKGRKKRC